MIKSKISKSAQTALHFNAFHFISLNPGIQVGTSWLDRRQLSESRVHRPLLTLLCGSASEGAYSLVLSGRHSFDVDAGDSFVFTGSGGKGETGVGPMRFSTALVADQELSGSNLALALNCHGAKIDAEKGGAAGKHWQKGKPVRVCRAASAKKYSKYAPEDGFRCVCVRVSI